MLLDDGIEGSVNSSGIGHVQNEPTRSTKALKRLGDALCPDSVVAVPSTVTPRRANSSSDGTADAATGARDQGDLVRCVGAHASKPFTSPKRPDQKQCP